jgi:signal peptidase I
LVIDFSFWLALAALVTGLIWAIDHWLFRPGRVARAKGGVVDEPVLVDYARSFFPIILAVLLIRAFLFEPFRIPSDSMMPTLLDGDFIFVNKYIYGLRLPVVNHKIVSISEPKRGDVVVFRKPTDPSTNYIKRLVGLPGDHIVVSEKRVYVNGVEQPVRLEGTFGPMNATPLARVGFEKLGEVEHRTLYIDDRPSADWDGVVPEGHYFFMGDNRDNSADSRFPDVGYVPSANIVGKAVRIWLNWNLPHAPILNRIGQAIH